MRHDRVTANTDISQIGFLATVMSAGPLRKQKRFAGCGFPNLFLVNGEDSLLQIALALS
jgi:hypothetical protein